MSHEYFGPTADHINSLTSHLNFGRHRINIKADHMNLNAYVFQAKAYQFIKRISLISTPCTFLSLAHNDKSQILSD